MQLTTTPSQRRKGDARCPPPEKTMIVVGASRGLGRGIATAFAQAGAPVVAVARTAAPLDRAGQRPRRHPSRRRGRHRRRRGGQPARPLRARGGRAGGGRKPDDARRCSTTRGRRSRSTGTPMCDHVPLAAREPCQAAEARQQGGRDQQRGRVAGSPLSGGYAGAKATQRFITGYAQDEARRAGLGITFTTVLPQITPLTDLGAPAVDAYAARNGQSKEEYIGRSASRSPRRPPAPRWLSS